MVKKLLVIMMIGWFIPLSAIGAQNATPAPVKPDYWPTQGWRTALPAEQGMNAVQLDAIPAQVEKEMPYVHSILIVRHGYIVFERYFAGSSDSSLNELMSVTKSITSALVGIALRNGDIKSVDTPFASLFPEYFEGGKNADKRDLTLRNLLMMRSGLTWDDATSATTLWQSSRDSIGSLINRPLAHKPGEAWNYSTGDSQLVSGMFTRGTGSTLVGYADKHLFGPLGIASWDWLKDSQGYNIGGARLSLTARDMAKFGYLYLNSGNWDGKQIVPVDWVRLTTGGQTDKPDYGYMWWIHEPKDSKDYRTFSAQGYAGQSIVVFPDLDLIVVTTTRAFVYSDQADLQSKALSDLIRGQILPAVVSAR